MLEKEEKVNQKAYKGTSQRAYSEAERGLQIGGARNSERPSKPGRQTAALKKRLKDYGKVLLAKQLMRALYNNPTEKNFKKNFGKEKTVNEVIGRLSSRLEIVLPAMGIAMSNNHARQLINHGKISVNGHVIKERGYVLKDGDIIASKVNFSAKPSDTESQLSSQESRGSVTLTEIAGIKPKKLPAYLKLKTPISANLLINPDLKCGIYYSLPIPDFDREKDFSIKSVGGLSLERTGFRSSVKSLSSRRSSGGIYKAEPVGLGWKNTTVKEIKNLLLAMQTATEEEKLKLGVVLYNLVQAYYSRLG